MCQRGRASPSACAARRGCPSRRMSRRGSGPSSPARRRSGSGRDRLRPGCRWSLRDVALPPTTVDPGAGAVMTSLGNVPLGDRGVHVGLDLRLGQCRPADPHVVDPALEVLTPRRVTADRERPRGVRNRAGCTARRDLDAVHVQPQRAAVYVPARCDHVLSGNAAGPKQRVPLPRRQRVAPYSKTPRGSRCRRPSLVDHVAPAVCDVVGRPMLRASCRW